MNALPLCLPLRPIRLSTPVFVGWKPILLFLLLISLVVLSPSLAIAQLLIRGNVMDMQRSNSPLVGAAVRVSGHQQGTVTDSSGQFSIRAARIGLFVQDLDIRSGEIYCLPNPDGAGKSTIITNCSVFIPVSSGLSKQGIGTLLATRGQLVANKLEHRIGTMYQGRLPDQHVPIQTEPEPSLLYLGAGGGPMLTVSADSYRLVAS